MAISDDRLEFNSITELTALDFNKVTDILNSRDVISPVSIASLATSPGGIFSDNAKQEAEKAASKEALKQIINCDVNGKSLSNYNKANNRGLYGSLIDDCIRKLNNLDRVLAVPKSLSYNFNPLPAMTENTVDSIMGNFNRTTLGGQTKDIVNENLLNSTIKKELFSKVGVLGMPIGAKLGMEKTAKGCKLSLSKLPELGKAAMMRAKMLGNLLKSMLCLGVNKVKDFIAGLIGSGAEDPTSIVKSLANTLGGEEDMHLGNKLGLLANYSSALSAADTATLGPRIASGINDNNKGEISSFGDMSNKLSIIDPNWNKDSSGQTNNSFMINNPYVVNQANNTTLNRTNNINYDGSVNTNIDSATEVSILSKFI